jgi:hypothetical protein
VQTEGREDRLRVTRIAVTSPPIMRTSTSYGISADSNNYFKSVATSTPIGCPSRSSGTASTERKRVLYLGLTPCVFQISQNIGELDGPAFQQGPPPAPLRSHGLL